MTRKVFTIVFCVTWGAYEISAWLLGFGFDHESLITAVFVALFFAWKMPDRIVSVTRNENPRKSPDQGTVTVAATDPAGRTGNGTAP